MILRAKRTIGSAGKLSCETEVGIEYNPVEMFGDGCVLGNEENIGLLQAVLERLVVSLDKSKAVIES